MKKTACTFEYLASTAFGQVLICPDCQVIHVQLQSVTLRFNVTAFIGIANTLATASVALKAIIDARKKPTPHKLTIVK